MSLKPLKHPRNTDAAGKVAKSKAQKTNQPMKRLALRSEGRVAANSDDDFEGSKPPQAKKRRFAVSVAEEVESSKKPLEVKNTQKSTMWAVRAFYSWLEEHNDRSEEKCPSEVLCMEDKALLCHWLCIFVKEARRENGEEYTPRSVSMLLSGLQRFINSKQEPHEPLVKLADPTNSAFRELHNVVEHRYRELHEKGIGATRKQADIVSKGEEQGLWESGTQGLTLH